MSLRVLLRGDLRSNTGYGRANRALGALLRSECEVIGADIHPDPLDNAGRPDFPLVTDQDLFALAANAAAAPRDPGSPTLVVHGTSPDEIRYFPGAANVGAFFWETDAIPHRRRWPLKLSLLSAIWAPTRFVAEFARSTGFRGPIDLVPWAHDFPALRGGAQESGGGGIGVDYVGAVDIASVAPTRIGLDALRQQARHLFLAVQSLAPRKGTRTLLREWRTYLRDHGRRDVLLLRLAYRHATDIVGEPMAHFARLLRAAGFRPGERTNLALITHALTDDGMRALYRCCDAAVTASFGEGFGGPVIEALQEGCPVIAPRHTGLADLIPPDYPLIVPSRRVVTGLIGNLDVYPASASWHIPQPGAIAAALARFSGFSVAERRHALDAARAHAIGFCSTARVRGRLHEALGHVLRPEPSRVPVAHRALGIGALA